MNDLHIFITGHGNLSVSHFFDHYVPILEAHENAHFHLCDFRGCDTLTMEFLKTLSTRVTIYHIGDFPRYKPDVWRTKVSSWTIKGGYTSDQDRDIAALSPCDHILALDLHSTPERLSGVGRNLKEAQQRGLKELR
jgi:hypothetical protein